MRALGFRLVDGPGYPNPVGLDGVFQGFCPPYYASMDAAVDAVIAVAARHTDAVAPHRPAEGDFRPSLSDEGVACAKAVCRYILETYGRFPASVDTMHLMWFMQVHHLDLDFYERYFHEGACGERHLAHMATWHS